MLEGILLITVTGKLSSLSEFELTAMTVKKDLQKLQLSLSDNL